MKNLSERLIRLYSKSPLSFTNPDKCYTTSDFLVLLARNGFLVIGCRNISECIYGKETNRTTTQPCWHINQRGISGPLLFGTFCCLLKHFVHQDLKEECFHGTCKQFSTGRYDDLCVLSRNCICHYKLSLFRLCAPFGQHVSESLISLGPWVFHVFDHLIGTDSRALPLYRF